MTELVITDSDLAGLRDKVVVITGGCSGIGFAAAQLALSSGAKVVVGDLQPPKNGFSPQSNWTFQQTDVTVWKDQVALFKAAKELHGRIDHVFANAGVSMKADYLSTEVDENGDLKEPSWACHDVNLRACTNTVTLAVYHMRPDQGGSGGSIVVTASIASFTHYRGVDYAVTKHGVLGLMRGLHALLSANGIPIRINAISPSWTYSGLVPKEAMDMLGIEGQPPEAAARSALILMADEKRDGELMHSVAGRCKEIEKGVFGPATLQVTGSEELSEDEVTGRLLKLMAAHQA